MTNRSDGHKNLSNQQTNRKTNWQTNRQTNRQTIRHSNRQTNIQCWYLKWKMLRERELSEMRHQVPHAWESGEYWLEAQGQRLKKWEECAKTGHRLCRKHGCCPWEKPSHQRDQGTKSATCLWTKERQKVRAMQKAWLVKDMRSKNVRKMTGQKSEECA